ncbi:MAG: Phosphopantetheine adenylyltransferase [Actinobacteria bacterium]|nr:Phosphopantetheine adenylyltransferase [Actinomycetota bacterium]
MHRGAPRRMKIGLFSREFGVVTIAVCPGSFDPVTMGHKDIIVRAARMYERVIVAVAESPSRKAPLFSLEKRLKFLNSSLLGLDNVGVAGFDGLLVEFAKAKKASVIIKGLRAMTDFEYEFQMAQINHKLYPEIETVFLVARPRYSFLSSSTVKEVAVYGGCLDDLVPEEIRGDIIRCFREKEF